MVLELPVLHTELAVSHSSQTQFNAREICCMELPYGAHYISLVDYRQSLLLRIESSYNDFS